jgi:hypothetical protein
VQKLICELRTLLTKTSEAVAYSTYAYILSSALRPACSPQTKAPGKQDAVNQSHAIVRQDLRRTAATNHDLQTV